MNFKKITSLQKLQKNVKKQYPLITKKVKKALNRLWHQDKYTFTKLQTFRFILLANLIISSTQYDIVQNGELPNWSCLIFHIINLIRISLI